MRAHPTAATMRLPLATLTFVFSAPVTTALERSGVETGDDIAQELQEQQEDALGPLRRESLMRQEERQGAQAKTGWHFPLPGFMHSSEEPSGSDMPKDNDNGQGHRGHSHSRSHSHAVHVSSSCELEGFYGSSVEDCKYCAGEVSKDRLSCEECPRGRFKPADVEDLLSAGHENTDSCFKCVGRVKRSKGHRVGCSKCPSGHYMPEGASEDDACAVCNGEVHRSEEGERCEPCKDDGFHYKANINSNSCKRCATKVVKVNGVFVCPACPAGKYRPHAFSGSLLSVLQRPAAMQRSRPLLSAGLMSLLQEQAKQQPWAQAHYAHDRHDHSDHGEQRPWGHAYHSHGHDGYDDSDGYDLPGYDLPVHTGGSQGGVYDYDGYSGNDLNGEYEYDRYDSHSNDEDYDEEDDDDDDDEERQITSDGCDCLDECQIDEFNDGSLVVCTVDDSCPSYTETEPWSYCQVTTTGCYCQEPCYLYDSGETRCRVHPLGCPEDKHDNGTGICEMRPKRAASRVEVHDDRSAAHVASSKEGSRNSGGTDASKIPALPPYHRPMTSPMSLEATNTSRSLLDKGQAAGLRTGDGHVDATGDSGDYDGYDRDYSHASGYDRDFDGIIRSGRDYSGNSRYDKGYSGAWGYDRDYDGYKRDSHGASSYDREYGGASDRVHGSSGHQADERHITMNGCECIDDCQIDEFNDGSLLVCSVDESCSTYSASSPWGYCQVTVEGCYCQEPCRGDQHGESRCPVHPDNCKATSDREGMGICEVKPERSAEHVEVHDIHIARSSAGAANAAAVARRGSGGGGSRGGDFNLGVPALQPFGKITMSSAASLSAVKVAHIGQTTLDVDISKSSASGSASAAIDEHKLKGIPALPLFHPTSGSSMAQHSALSASTASSASSASSAASASSPRNSDTLHTVSPHWGTAAEAALAAPGTGGAGGEALVPAEVPSLEEESDEDDEEDDEDDEAVEVKLYPQRTHLNCECQSKCQENSYPDGSKDFSCQVKDVNCEGEYVGYCQTTVNGCLCEHPCYVDPETSHLTCQIDQASCDIETDEGTDVCLSPGSLDANNGPEFEDKDTSFAAKSAEVSGGLPALPPWHGANGDLGPSLLELGAASDSASGIQVDPEGYSLEQRELDDHCIPCKGWVGFMNGIASDCHPCPLGMWKDESKNPDQCIKCDGEVRRSPDGHAISCRPCADGLRSLENEDRCAQVA